MAAVRGFCAVHAVPAPLARSNAGTASMLLSVAAKIVVDWSDGTVTTYDPGAAGYAPRLSSIYDTTGATATVDGTKNAYIVCSLYGETVLGGLPHLWLMKESDIPNGDTLASAIAGATKWAPLWRINGDVLTPYPQWTQAAGTLPTSPVEGDMVYYHSGTWTLLHTTGFPGMLMSDGIDPSWLNMTTNGVIPTVVAGSIHALPLGTPNQVLTNAGGNPGWVNVADLLLALIPNNGDLIMNNAGTVVRLPIPGSAAASGQMWVLASVTGTSSPQWVQFAYP